MAIAVVSTLCMKFPAFIAALPRTCSAAVLSLAPAHDWIAAPTFALHHATVAVLPALVLFSTREQVYNVLWGLVFGFATLNILSLGARRFEQRSGLTFGEVLAILVVGVSVILLGWEMLYVFHILPIHLSAN
jgi:hypothetical protein